MESKHITIAVKTKFLDIFIKKRLEAEGYTVEKVADGSALLAAAAAGQTGIIMAQTGIDGVDALDLCKKIKEDKETSKISIIVLSHSPADKEAAAEAGADDFLGVPLDENLLIETVQKLVEKGVRKTVLLVDDSKVIHLRTGNFLREHGFNVIDAYNGQEGFDMCKSNRPDIVISDVEMPVMDGFAMCKQIKTTKEVALIPVIISSSLGQGLDIEKGFDCGANDYLVKPVVNEEMMSTISNLLKKMDMRRGEKVLIADADERVVNMLEFAMVQHGFQVITCADGEEAFEATLRDSPDVVVVAREMPKTDGYQLIEYFKEKPDTADIPVIILTDRDSKAEAAKGLKIGAAAIISKPFSMDKVMVNVERLSAERRLKRERERMKMYMSEAVMTMINAGGATSDGYHVAQKELTILFSDIKGFTTMSEKMEPAKVVSVLNKYLDAMTTALKNHEGIIDKFIGDAIMCIFIPQGRNDNASLRAIKGGLEMLQAQMEYNRTSDVQIRTRIGINRGKVILGDLGSQFHRRDFTVIGDAVNTAQRLESNANPDTVLISDAVYQQVSDAIIVEEKGDLQLKGKEVKIKTYTVLGLSH